jgi:hypothetical protein
MQRRYSGNLLAMGAGRRVGLAALLVAGLWLCVLWAL